MDTVAVCCTLPLSVNDVALHTPTSSPPQAQTTSHNPLHAPSLTCCDVYTTCAAIHPTELVLVRRTTNARYVGRAPRVGGWERSARHVEGLAREW